MKAFDRFAIATVAASHHDAIRNCLPCASIGGYNRAARASTAIGVGWPLARRVPPDDDTPRGAGR
ncbi:hypothetical protein WS70_15925 [Burkholderia mayonis]|uniref:Uncharacterized protein n=1 Tax=Burkholderia mayonis TaxID=1385591 RepID=A0A1B4FHT8_9BURK|nr:hypothetical protein WS70_15925 [Burkholderia mayonis]KVE39052.1 hypothetical protein WS69_01530 [Burkholderia sp. BDU5]KVE48262.1 hypothetical protein WS70_24300 [Burkholderia mayonis]